LISGSTYGYTSTTTTSSIAYAKASSGAVQNPWTDHGAGLDYNTNEIVEAAINITKLFAQLQPCVPTIRVKTIMVETKTSTSVTKLEDFTYPILQSNIVFGTTITYGGPFCAGPEHIVQVDHSGLNPSGSYYTTNAPNNRITVDYNTGAITIKEFYPLTPETYTVTYHFKPSGCATDQTTTTDVVVNPKPSVSNHETNLCPGGKYNLTNLAITPGLTYSYWYDASATSPIPVGTYTQVTAGTYYVKGTSDAGCSAIGTVTVTAVDTAAPTFNAPGAITIHTTASCAYDAAPTVTGVPTALADNCTSVANLAVTHSER
jgi:hypothetical protein